MNCRKFILCLAVCLLPTLLSAQNKVIMSKYQSDLQVLFDQVYNAPDEAMRFRASDEALELFRQALAEENSFRWQWDFGSQVSVLTAPDGKFRIFTWHLMDENYEYECFGLLQVYSEKAEGYVVHTLVDKSADMVNRQESTLAPDNWFGAVYQELVTTTHDGKTYYTLLGWSGVDCLTQRKVIEPLTFKGNAATPQFGMPVFKKERNLRRIVLEYRADAMVNLRYEEQFVQVVERVRPKQKRGRKRKKGKAVVQAPTEKVTETKELMILFDEVAPQIPGMEGLFQYYVPSGVEMAYVWDGGKWALREGAQGRVADKKLNKDFAPIEKAVPAYKLRIEN